MVFGRHPRLHTIRPGNATRTTLTSSEGCAFVRDDYAPLTGSFLMVLSDVGSRCQPSAPDGIVKQTA